MLQRITTERQNAGRRPASLVQDRGPFDTAARLIAGGSSEEDAIRTAMGRIAEAESTEVRGWVVEGDDLDQVDMPSVFVEREELEIVVVVIDRGAVSGQQRGRYLVCDFIVEEGVGPELEHQ